MATSFSRQLHSQESQEEVAGEAGSGLESSCVQKDRENRTGEALNVTEEEEEDEEEGTEDKHHKAASMEPQHLYLKTETKHYESPGNTMKDFRLPTFPALETVLTDADISAFSHATGSVPIFPSKEVEGALQLCLALAEAQVKRVLQQAIDSVQSEVLCALHQAASDISEHLGKEAAHRVLIAEQKADLLELELSNVKQQALSMLLHLKVDSAAQARESDKKYVVERRRAQEAEAKLAIANDNLKRLKSELKRKGGILNKMQKLVQPETDDKFSEGTEIVQDSSRSVSTEMHRRSPQSRNLRAVEYSSFFICNKMPNQESPSPAKQHNNPALQVSNKKLNVSEDNSAATKGFLDLQRQISSSSETFQNDHFSPSLQEELPAEKVKQEERGSKEGYLTVVDVSRHEEESLRAKLLDSCEGIDCRQAEQMQGGQLPANSMVLDGKVEREILNNQRIMEDEDVGALKSPNATVRGFYVRRKVRENGNLLEKRGSSLAMGKPNPSNVEDIQSNSDAFQMLSHEIGSDLPTSDLQRCPEGQINVGSLDCSLAHAQCPGEPLPPSVDEIRMADRLDETNTNDFNSLSKVQRLVEAVEFARPDYEVATSLAELAAGGFKGRTQQQEEAPLTAMKKGDHFLRPGKTGLRMKRKGISFDKKTVLDVDSKTSKKLRLNDKLVTGVKESHRGRVSRRTRGNKCTSAKVCLSLESSRDSRRLMQGARQLLCLAEKKWR